MKSSVKKVSLVLKGHKTSISLEPDFYAEVKRIAGERDMSVSTMIEEIEAEATCGNLSSQVRLTVLRDLKARAGMAA